MRVFVTGATGFIGSAIVQELLGAGHQVLGLARSEAAARALITAGADVHRGSLDDFASLQRGVEAADGVIHTGFIHDFSNFKANAELDRNVIKTMGTVLAGSDRPFVITSALAVLTPGQLAVESDRPLASPNPRVASEEAADAVAAQGVRASVVRLPPSVHGDGDSGFVPTLIQIARATGISAYRGDGLNHWPAVHRLDVAQLYRLALEQDSAPGTRWHGVAEEGIVFRDIAEVIGRRLNLPVVSQSADEATTHFGWFARFAALDIPASGQQTQQHLNWRPTQPGLLSDIDRESYFTGGGLY